MKYRTPSRTRAMIWLYPTTSYFWSDPDTGTNYLWDGFELEQLHYLDDYNLTMPLAFENELQIYMPLKNWHDDNAKVVGQAGGGKSGGKVIRSFNPSTLRAITEVLVKIKLEEMGL